MFETKKNNKTKKMVYHIFQKIDGNTDNFVNILELPRTVQKIKILRCDFVFRIRRVVY